MFVIELAEVKSHPLQNGPFDFEDLNRKTVGLLLRIMKKYFATGRYVILDSGICVLKWLTQLRKKGIFCLCCNKEEKVLDFHGPR